MEGESDHQSENGHDVDNVEMPVGGNEPNPPGFGGIQPRFAQRFRQHLEPVIVQRGMAVKNSKTQETNYSDGDIAKSIKSDITGHFSIVFTSTTWIALIMGATILGEIWMAKNK